MCLIAYSPKGAMIDRTILAYAYNKNPDGIGIMSAYGIEKFLGHKALKRARRYLETYLAGKDAPFAIHFRWATHGEIGIPNTHPYEAPQGMHWIMHNGVISLTTGESTAAESDTAVFVRKYMDDIQPFDDKAYYTGIESKIGWGNKLCIMDADGEFKLCNDDAGEWIDGFWFSNTYSLPSSFVPVKMQWGGYHGGYYGSRSSYYVEPKETWDYNERKFLPNPAYKAAELAEAISDALKDAEDKIAAKDVAKEAKGRATILQLPAPRTVWPSEERRAYYEALEAGLTPEEALDYEEASVEEEAQGIGEIAALRAAREEELTATERHEKELADIGGDFAPEEDSEDQNRFRQYLKRVAAGVFI